MTMVQRQIWWFGLFLVLLVGSGGLFFWLPHRVSVLHIVAPALLAYGWLRFILIIWKPLYKQEVSPGWCVTLLFAAFGIFFMLMSLYRVASDEFGI
jgi:hypothetical protein